MLIHFIPQKNITDSDEINNVNPSSFQSLSKSVPLPENEHSLEYSKLNKVSFFQKKQPDFEVEPELIELTPL